ncbi:Uncharacterised protein [Klebsiella pneumoniae]|nr:Uncharacterised protein [Klebsiella pneumoniae]
MLRLARAASLVAAGLQNVVFLWVLLHQELQRLIKGRQFARLRAGINFVARAIIGNDFPVLDFEGLTEPRLKQICRNCYFICDEFRARVLGDNYPVRIATITLACL